MFSVQGFPSGFRVLGLEAYITVATFALDGRGPATSMTRKATTSVFQVLVIARAADVASILPKSPIPLN